MIPKSELVLELFVAVLASLDGRLRMLDDHVTPETEGMSRDLAAQLAPEEPAVVFRVDTALKEIHDPIST